MLDTPSDLHIMCQVNDCPIYQDHQERTSQQKPDVAILPFKCTFAALPEEKHDGDNRLINTATKQETRLVWKDMLACIEFKRPTKKLSKSPLSYEVAPYKSTNPEYRCVEHTVPDAPASAAAPAPDSESTHRSARLAAGSQNVCNNPDGKRKATETLQFAGKRAKTDDDTEPKLDLTVQTGLYATEMFAANVAVKYLVNLVVVDDVVWVWQCDRQGSIIECSGINFIEDLPRFMPALLYASQRFSLVDWGRNAGFKHDEKNHSHKLIIDDVDLEVHKDRMTHYGLKEYATNVFPVTSEKLAKDNQEIAKDDMVAKVFWAEEQRTSEPDILKKVYEIAEEQDAVKGHVPHLLWHHKFQEPMSKIREALGISEPAEGSRVLYILVFRKLKPITELKGT
ncbi:hypothetical protein AZE42_07281, partial [Rhizopogon vesiculosus]